jgi:GNAT superfamily N-acetyltransferase
MPTIAYQKSRPEDRAAVLGALAEGQSPAEIARREGVFDWQFGGENPHSDGRAPFWLALEDGQIAGVNGLLPVKIRYRKEPVLAVWSCDTIVYERHRGKGIGKGLLGRISAEADVVLGYGIGDMSDPILVKLGWELGRDLRGFFFYANEEGPKGLVKNVRSRLMRLALGRPADGAIDVVKREGEPFGAEVDALWKSCAPGYVNAVERDAAYLSYRYHRHPRLRYVAYYARRAGQLLGVLIARPDANEAVIADYCGPIASFDLKAALVDAAVTDLSRRGTRRIRCETTDRTLAEVLARAGFRESTSSTFRFRVWSNRPGDRGRAEGWFLMTGDSDNDLGALGSG